MIGFKFNFHHRSAIVYVQIKCIMDVLKYSAKFGAWPLLALLVGPRELYELFLVGDG